MRYFFRRSYEPGTIHIQHFDHSFGSTKIETLLKIDQEMHDDVSVSGRKCGILLLNESTPRVFLESGRGFHFPYVEWMLNIC